MLLQADARHVPLRDASVDAIVTDPPYGLGFMGKEWDKLGEVRRANRGTQPNRKRPPGESGASPKFNLPAPAFDLTAESQRGMYAWHYEWASAALRVAKPGAHLLAFGGTRTHHRLTCALEDAGWEIRDCLMWLYGSGFPKSLDVSKALDRMAGAEREIVSEGRPVKRMIPGADQNATGSWIKDSGRVFVPSETLPATDAARAWSGYGTALKPAWEPIILARKPLDGTVAQNVLKWGCGALNVDGSRIGTQENTERPAPLKTSKGCPGGGWGHPNSLGRPCVTTSGGSPLGRFPANLLLDEESAAMLDVQSGELTSGKESEDGHRRNSDKHRNVYAGWRGEQIERGALIGDSGGASRFFYVAKASRSERGRGNTHPTVKPVDLMRYLCRLVTPKGGLILDPFMGSGTTLVAAEMEGFRVIGARSGR